MGGKKIKVHSKEEVIFKIFCFVKKRFIQFQKVLKFHFFSSLFWFKCHVPLRHGKKDSSPLNSFVSLIICELPCILRKDSGVVSHREIKIFFS